MSGTDLPMTINQPEIMLMLKTLGFRVILRCRFQIYNRISKINNVFVDISCPVFN